MYRPNQPFGDLLHSFSKENPPCEGSTSRRQDSDEPELLRGETQGPRVAPDGRLDAALGGGDQQADMFLLTQHLRRQLIAGRPDRQA